MSLYHQIVDLSVPYFGTRADTERFLARQCKGHLNVDPERLGPHDLWNLAKWVEIPGDLVLKRGQAGELKDKILNLRKAMGPVPVKDRLSGGDFRM